MTPDRPPTEVTTPLRGIGHVVVVSSALLLVPLLLPLVMNGIIPLNDLIAYHLPFRHVFSTALHRGDSMLWTSSVFGGYYLFGEGQLAMAHPWHLLLYRFLPLTTAFGVELVASYVALYAGMVMWLRRLGFALESRLFGAMVFTFSGYNIFHVIHPNIIAVVAHVPWLLLSCQALVDANDRKAHARAFIATALIFASQILSGHPQHVWLAVILVGCLCMFFIWRNDRLARIGRVVPALGLGGLLAGVQLLPLLDVVTSSQRADWGAGASLTYSLLPSNILQLWSPFFFERGARTISIERNAIHEFIVYNGAFCTVAVVWIVMRWRSLRRRRLAAAALMLAIVALILALGRYGGLYTSLLALPLLRWFRVPARHLLLVHLSLSVLAVIAFEDLLEMWRRRESLTLRRFWPLAIPAVLSVVTMSVGWMMLRAGSQEPLSTIGRSAPWTVLFVAVPLLFIATTRGHRWALPLLVLVTAFDQGYWGFQYVLPAGLRSIVTVNRLNEFVDVPDGGKPGDLIDRDEKTGLDNLPILRGYRVLGGYVGLVPNSALRLDHADRVAQRIAGTAWYVATGSRHFQAVPDPAPRARLLTHVTVSSDVAADVRTINILDEALVDTPIVNLAGSPGSVQVIDDRPGMIVVDTTTSGPQLLVLTERFHSGWQVREESLESGSNRLARDVEPVRVYGDFLGSVVPAGSHRVTFRFAPRNLRYGLMTSGVGLLILLAATVFAL